MRIIGKFNVPISDEWHRHESGPVLYVGLQAPLDLNYWAEIDTEAEIPWRWLRVFGTGQPLPDNAQYVGTVQDVAHSLVWHLYERIEGKYENLH